MPDFKPISRDAIPAALEKVERYRLLNEPELAESICHDVLAVDPHNQKALVMLLLALTDQFFDGTVGCVRQAEAVVPQIEGEYERLYYSGIIWESPRPLPRVARRPRQRRRVVCVHPAGDVVLRASRAACARPATTTRFCAGTRASGCASASTCTRSRRNCCNQCWGMIDVRTTAHVARSAGWLREARDATTPRESAGALTLTGRSSKWGARSCGC